ncbi:MAG TPA: hypothetical protein VNH18_07120 [Bryobacteraceae bacterium]|nr:hypothetical protein [Bryobacteraceae bacterium]
MIPNNLDDPDYWHEELAPLLREIDLALQASVPQAREFFDTYLKRVVNRPLLSNLTRYFMLEYLKKTGFNPRDLDDEDGDGWSLKNLSNNGIEIMFRGSCIRIRKGVEAPLPATRAAQDFYQQVLNQEFAQATVLTNIMVMWNLTRGLEYEGEMYLLRPKSGNRKKVKLAWRKRVQLDRISITQTVEPAYGLPSDLPIDPAADTERKDKTGTDDAD